MIQPSPPTGQHETSLPKSEASTAGCLNGSQFRDSGRFEGADFVSLTKGLVNFAIYMGTSEASVGVD